MSSNSKRHISEQRIQDISAMLAKLNINSNKLFSTNKLHKFEIINEALIHSSAQFSIDYERLEFLGDAVLRLAASEFIDWNYPKLKVGERSALRAHLVSDHWLTKIGAQIDILDVLIVGTKAAGDSFAQATLQAEATEALIGAIYKCFNNLEIIHKWLTPYWKEQSENVLADPYKNNSKSALQEWAQRKGFSIPKYINEEIHQQHGNPQRFFSKVYIDNESMGEGWGSSRKYAEKEAALFALKKIESDESINSKK